MPVSRRYTRSRRVRKARRVTRHARRRATRTRYRRPYASRVSKRRSARRVLNITSTKKKDTMRALTNVNTAGGLNATNPRATAPSTNDLFIRGDHTAITVHSITARDFSFNDRVNTTRNSDTCFMKGFVDSYDVTTNSGLSWQHRRIVFSAKGLNALRVSYDDGGSTGPFTWPPQLTDGGDYYRNMMDIQYSDYADLRTYITSYLFDGEVNIDWNSWTNAKLAKQRFTVHSDRTVIFNAGNERGMNKKYRMYDAFNRNLYYDVDEQGTEGKGTTPWAANRTAGMGDAWVVDIFAPHSFGNGDDRMQVNVQSTLYWHEK